MMRPDVLKIAPGGLALLQAFINTLYMDKKIDQLSGPEALRSWLVGHDLIDADEVVTAADLQWAIEVREALRELLLSNSGITVDPLALETLNRAASRTRLVLGFSPEGRTELLSDGGGVDRALGEILAQSLIAMVAGTWRRLKVCSNETCRWAFYDLSKNRSGMWCSMAECGNRMKARAYRRRHGQTSPDPA
jgi:predicted RNA-binding Zn ribbon-like protein